MRNLEKPRILAMGKGASEGSWGGGEGKGRNTLLADPELGRVVSL